MNNNSSTAKSSARTRIAIALTASLIALWQLPDPAAQESSLSQPVERLIPKQEELNILAQPATAVKPIRHLSL
jgi:hypothetical protein